MYIYSLVGIYIYIWTGIYLSLGTEGKAALIYMVLACRAENITVNKIACTYYDAVHVLLARLASQVTI